MNEKRSKARLKRLKTRKISKVKQEYLDIDYLSKLSPKDQLWLADFMAETLNAEVKSKTRKQNRFHKSKESVKDVYDKNNARQRDSFGQMRAQGRLMYLSNENMSEYFDTEKTNLQNDQENAMVDLIDQKRALEKESKSED